MILCKKTKLINDTAEETENDGYVYISDSKKRLEEIKLLYENGLINKDEYEEKRKNIIDNI